MSGRMIAVTGGNRGIGAATARLFAAEGWRVAILYGSDAEAAAVVRASLPGEGHHAVRADVADPASVAAAAAELDRVFGALDVLVNNAGWTRAIPHADLDALDEATIERIFRINAMGPLFCVRAFLPLLHRRERAVIVNISSVAAKRGQGSNIAYCAAKAAVDTMTMSLGRALAPAIRVVAIAPGPVETGMARMWTPEQREATARATPLGWAKPEEIAVTIHAVVTAMPKVTGTTILADGGRALA
jgi:3-oxoacyl-[acyl-carrier protein] reductase